MIQLLSEQLSSSGGPVLIALFVISVAAGAVAIFKAMQFSRMGVGRSVGTERSLTAWTRGDFDEATQLARIDRSPASAAVAGAMISLLNYPADRDRAREVAAHVALHHLTQMSRHLRFLETVAQAAPMLGLLGTVIGMISAFGELSAKGGAIDPSALAGGIWVALITTAAGLTVAIPVYFLSMWFEGRVDHERAYMEAAIAKVLFSIAPLRPADAIVAEPETSFSLPRATVPASLGG
ncbi:MotA/TolQ/ExbB proton channel family protein [Pseudaminobacter sp. 19-2017]|uniref:MotA/TolQ/ExbB proton channel family protein n=1 Tax=Pseudaminobacter soli (ex Zhang et al. 2022) TaxID=2831468 RepID=A0A942DY81_9HYPH|nr:MotA/TolQ/ExbB proton channel family protein [Pseudaminobacter soli]MBS3650129.1 MotA/TolQ/ExbB proton channel family protein [Pseudaminobacter soli]